MTFQINFKSGLPVYLQLVEQVRTAAASGVLRSGDPLPSIRPLAEDLRVNRNTVAKAYAELESQGIVETQPGKGCFVREPDSILTRTAREQMVATELDRAVVAAHHLKIARERFRELADDRWIAFDTGRNGADETAPPQTKPRDRA